MYKTHLTQNDIKLALHLSKTIQEFLESTGDVNLRSTDVFPYLKRHGFFKHDNENGKEFRIFLKKLYKSNNLENLIPQCRYLPSLTNKHFGEWYFNPIHRSKSKLADNKVSRSNQGEHSNIVSKSTSNKMNIEESVDIIKQLINGINPLTERPQDNLGVCSELTVIEALKTIIDPYNFKESLKYLKEVNKQSNQGNSTYFKRMNTEVFNGLKKPDKEYYSATALGKLVNKNYTEVVNKMKKIGFVDKDLNITYKGFDKGLKYEQKPKGEKWIVYPLRIKDLLD